MSVNTIKVYNFNFNLLYDVVDEYHKNFSYDDCKTYGWEGKCPDGNSWEYFGLTKIRHLTITDFKRIAQQDTNNWTIFISPNLSTGWIALRNIKLINSNKLDNSTLKVGSYALYQIIKPTLKNINNINNTNNKPTTFYMSNGTTSNQTYTINTFFHINPIINIFSFNGNRKILADTSISSIHNNLIKTNSVSYDHSNLDFNVKVSYNRKVYIHNLSNLYQYKLDMGDGTVYNLNYFNSISHTYKKNGNYSITLYGYRNNIFLKKVTKTVSVHYEPLYFIKHFLVYINNKTATFVDIYNTNNNILWDFGDGNKGYGSKVIYTYKDDGIYTVKRIFNNEVITSTIIIGSSENISFLDNMQNGIDNQGLTERTPNIGLGYDLTKSDEDDFGKLSSYNSINHTTDFTVTDNYNSYFGYPFKQIQYSDTMDTLKLSVYLSDTVVNTNFGDLVPSFSLRFINTALPISASLRFSHKPLDTNTLMVDFSLLHGPSLEDLSDNIDYLYYFIPPDEEGVVKHNTYIITNNTINLIIKNTGTTLEIYDWNNIHLYTVPIPNDEDLSDDLPNYDINNLFTDFMKGLTFNVSYNSIANSAPA